jgi:hypothetical protein
MPVSSCDEGPTGGGGLAPKSARERMSLLQREWGWLTQARQRNGGKAHPDLNPYDVKRLVEELNLKAEARRLGEAGVPAPDATRPGGAEAEAIQRVDRVRQDYVDWAAVRLSVLNERLEKTDSHPATQTCRCMPRTPQ